MLADSWMKLQNPEKSFTALISQRTISGEVPPSRTDFMSDLFLIFYHNITGEQKEDAHQSLGVKRIIDLPQAMKTLWRQIPAELDRIAEYPEPVKDWLGKHSRNGEYVLIQ